MKPTAMQKTLRITAGNGEVWDIPANVIATHRANYFVRKGYGKNPICEQATLAAKMFREEFAFAIADSYELIDWARNNMGWSDLSDYATKVKDATVAPIEDAWNNGDVSHQVLDVEVPQMHD